MQSYHQEMTVLDVFSGIGGISLGLHWAGMRTVAFCEAGGAGGGCCGRIGRECRCIGISGRCRPAGCSGTGCHGLPCCAAGSPARTSAWPGGVRGSMVYGPGCGSRWRAWSPSADRVGWWLRTSLACEAGGRTGSWPTWRLRATPGGRSWWVLSMPGHRTGGPGCGWWPGLLPTVVARDWKAGSVRQQGRRRACQLNDALGGRLHPAFAEWMMGFPSGWTAAGAVQR